MEYRNKIYRNFTPYTPGEQPTEDGWIKLNTNENPYPPAPAIFRALKELSENGNLFRKYPNPAGEPLRSALAKKYGLSPENYIVTNGSDEALAIICRVFLSPDESVVAPEITYSLYSTLTASVGAKYLQVPPLDRKSFAVDLGQIERSDAKIAFISNPNAQTGEYFSLAKLSEIIKGSKKLWIIDEAYNDFVTEQNRSFIPLLSQHQNAIVVRTFSKSYSLAGMRIGYAVSANPDLIEGILSGKDSYNEDALSLLLGKLAIEDDTHFTSCIKKILSEKTRLQKVLEEKGFYIVPSQANFLLAMPPEKINAQEILEGLKKQKILVRHFKQNDLEKFIRITIGTEEENSRLISGIEAVLEKK